MPHGPEPAPRRTGGRDRLAGGGGGAHPDPGPLVAAAGRAAGGGRGSELDDGDGLGHEPGVARGHRPGGTRRRRRSGRAARARGTGRIGPRPGVPHPGSGRAPMGVARSPLVRCDGPARPRPAGAWPAGTTTRASGPGSWWRGGGQRGRAPAPAAPRATDRACRRPRWRPGRRPPAGRRGRAGRRAARRRGHGRGGRGTAGRMRSPDPRSSPRPNGDRGIASAAVFGPRSSGSSTRYANGMQRHRDRRNDAYAALACALLVLSCVGGWYKDFAVCAVSLVARTASLSNRF